MKKSAATIRDIARQAGVSTATVSRVLSNNAPVKEATARKVLKAVREAKFKPNAIARSFLSQRSQMLALVLPPLTNPYYASFCEGAVEAAGERGYVISLFRRKIGHSITRADADIMMSRRYDGVILVYDRGASKAQTEENDILDELKDYMSIVVIDAPDMDYPYPVIFPDVRLCTVMAVRYLGGLGHRAIAMIGDFDDGEVNYSRERGYRAALAELNIPYRQDYRETCTCDTKSGQAATTKMLLALRRDQWPSAIVAANDLVALGVMHALTLQGLRVPEDVSVIGCDNQFYTPFVSPTLTSIDIHSRDIGFYAVKMLLEPDTPPYQPRYEIIERKSCRALTE